MKTKEKTLELLKAREYKIKRIRYDGFYLLADNDHYPGLTMSPTKESGMYI